MAWDLLVERLVRGRRCEVARALMADRDRRRRLRWVGRWVSLGCVAVGVAGVVFVHTADALLGAYCGAVLGWVASWWHVRWAPPRRSVLVVEVPRRQRRSHWQDVIDEVDVAVSLQARDEPALRLALAEADAVVIAVDGVQRCRELGRWVALAFAVRRAESIVLGWSVAPRGGMVAVPARLPRELALALGEWVEPAELKRAVALPLPLRRLRGVAADLVAVHLAVAMAAGVLPREEAEA
ncbi:MAG: hypothetical protein KTR31_35885 [Myxococcales bacterium]|nr:hypothetical protein [Myxococcales bacterium]